MQLAMSEITLMSQRDQRLSGHVMALVPLRITSISGENGAA
jgi:hypothetical protein